MLGKLFKKALGAIVESKKHKKMATIVQDEPLVDFPAFKEEL